VRVSSDQSPAPSTANRSCVYVLRSDETGLLYCGQTDDLSSRLQKHKRSR
jgi:predicted GIY-YIG superfamily endonuclease